MSVNDEHISRFNKIDVSYVIFEELQTEIETLSDESDVEYSERTSFEDNYFSLVATAHCC